MNSPAESGLKTTAPTPDDFSPHSISSVTRAVESAKSRSPAGSFSFLRPKRMLPRPKLLLLRRLAFARFDLLRLVAGADLGLQLRQLLVDLVRLRDLRQLAVELRAVVGEILERADRRQLVD